MPTFQGFPAWPESQPSKGEVSGTTVDPEWPQLYENNHNLFLGPPGIIPKNSAGEGLDRVPFWSYSTQYAEWHEAGG